VATSGPNQSGAVAEFDDGWQPFSNVANAITFDQVYSTVTIGGELSISNYLDYTGFGTFTGIGAGDSVTAVEIEVAGKTAATGTPTMLNAQLIVGGVVVGDIAPVDVSVFTSTETYQSSGVITVGSPDFGTTLTGADLTSNFGVRIQFSNDGTQEVFSVDACRVTLTYSSGTTYTIDVTAGAFSETGQSADVLVTRNIDVTAGAFTESGQTTDIPVTREVDASAGTFTLTGQPLDVQVPTATVGDNTTGLRSQLSNLRSQLSGL